MVEKLKYSYSYSIEAHSFPLPLIDSIQLIANFYAANQTNKLCLVFPSKELAAQWLSIPMVLCFIKSDYRSYNGEILEKYKSFKRGEKLILNDEAIVEFVGLSATGVSFKTKEGKEASETIITIPFSQVFKLKSCDQQRKLSAYKRVIEILPKRVVSNIDTLLEIKTFGSYEFIKNKVCLVTKYKSFEESIDDVKMNFITLSEYFEIGKIDENGVAPINRPLLITNNLCNLALHLVSNQISKIIIDGFSAIDERRSDFADIDEKNIPTILVTDLSEIESFESIHQCGFEFFNFTKENLRLTNEPGHSPFHSFDNKLYKYIHFNIRKEVCNESEIDSIAEKIHSIERDESNNDLNILKIQLIQLANALSRLCHIPSSDELVSFQSNWNTINRLFLRNRIWLGESHNAIEEIISQLNILIQKLTTEPTEKCTRLRRLMSENCYDYIICSSREEAELLKRSLPNYKVTRIISVADVNASLLSTKPVKAIITGWPKSNNVNRIIASFFFSELTFLFYLFENRYYNSLRYRNKKNSDKIRSTISGKGIVTANNSVSQNGFDDLYSTGEQLQTFSDSALDIHEFELNLTTSEYSKYTSNGNLVETLKAKRLDFENHMFIYSSESHKFLIINDLINKRMGKGVLHRRRLDGIQPGDIIALINTERDVLAELVEKNTNKSDLVAVKEWTDLWKRLLKDYFISIGNDFKKLVYELRKIGCQKHEVTIRTWLQDENRIGPDDDADLICIALVTNSKLLYDNISKVREAIRKMTGWRMKASDFISDKIRARIHEFANGSVNQRISIEGLGSVFVLKVTEVSSVWENVDARFANRLLQKELI